MDRPNVRAVGILIKRGKILLIYREKEGKIFWVFPGGGVEKGEEVEAAVVREIWEEASIKCEVIKLLYTHKYPDINHNQYYYLCRYISGAPKLGNFNELKTMKNEDQVYRPKWIKIRKLPKMLLYPLEIRNWVINDYKNNFEDTPKKSVLNTTDLRQKL